MEVRLNSPLGKFKITNMADDQVNLTPEDISGASICEKDRKIDRCSTEVEPSKHSNKVMTSSSEFALAHILTS